MTPALLAIAEGHDMGDRIITNADEGKSGPRGSAPGAPKTVPVAAEHKRLRDALPSGRNFHCACPMPTLQVC